AEGIADISFTVQRDDLQSTIAAVQLAADELEAEGVTFDDSVSKVSVVGVGMSKQTGVARQMFRSLADAGINLQMISTSEIKISVLVDRNQAALALRTVHKAYQLEMQPKGAEKYNPPVVLRAHDASDAVAVISRLQRMED